MRSTTRLALAASVLVGALLVLVLFTNVFRPRDAAPVEFSTVAPASPTETPAAGGSQDAAASGTRWSIDALGAPDDPLPAPRPLSEIGGPVDSDQAAETLARQVLAGGPDSFPALIAAFQASGIAILGPENAVAAKPAEPWQGMIMQRWEARTAAVMVVPQRTVTFTLANLTDVLVAAVPELKGAAVEQLIVSDVRALADSPVPTRRFLGRFIVALGRNATSHTPYDLVATVDPQTIRIDGLQASLIVRRLATDILIRTGNKNEKKAASLFDPLGWLEPTVSAQSAPPCTLDDRTRTIMDMVALGSQLGFGGMQVGELGFQGINGYLESHGFPGADRLGTLSAISSTLLAYAQFIAIYSALEVDVTMEGAPLVRTKKRAPQTGERKQLTAIVRMNIGNAQMLNCFRIMLNAIGQDFSVPNDGPVKGARVLWYGVEGFDQAAAALHGGSEAIVQFAAPEESHVQGGGNASSGANPVTNAITGEDGKVQIGVEGRGQREDISNDATEVRKSARVRLDVALKGSDLFGDLQEATGTAAGGLVGLATLPLSILYRTQWASAGHHSFAVTDWRDGPAEWTGTITYTKVTEWNTSESHDAVHREQEYSEKLTLNVNITETLEGDNVFGNAGAAMQGTAQANVTLRNLRSGGRLNRCSGVVTDMKSTQLDTTEGSGSGTARATVGISADGQYSVTLYPEVSVTTRNNYTVQSMTYGKLCEVQNESRATPGGGGSMRISIALQGDGKIDPKTPDRLSGRTEEKEDRTTQTLSWDLQRK